MDRKLLVTAICAALAAPALAPAAHAQDAAQAPQAASADQSEEISDTVYEGVEEHHVVDLLIGELRGMSPEDPQFDAKLTVLCENVDHHIEEEEGEMLPDARKVFTSAELSELAEQMWALKERFSV